MAVHGDRCMSVIKKLASVQNRRDDIPNQQLAKAIAEIEDSEAIKELVENLDNRDKNIQSDCIKVLYEIGYVKPRLIQQYVNSFLKLLSSKNNRLVWGGMIALSTIATLKADRIFEQIDQILKAIKNGSVITVDYGIKTLSKVASVKEEYNKKIFPYLIEHLRSCRPNEIPRHAESILVAITNDNKSEFLKVLRERKDILKPSQVKRVDKVIKLLN
jgi:hypothetical protein